MNTMKRCVVLAGLALSMGLAGCAGSPEPFDYQHYNELKPGPGIFTGQEGAYTIYGPPPVEAKQPAPAEEDPAKPVAQ